MIKHILVVDDSPIARRMLIKSLNALGSYEITEARDGQEGIEKFKTASPDVTFLDLTMPVLDGYEALIKIKEINTKAIVIVVTADIQPKSIGTVMGNGAFSVIKKPAPLETVKNILEKAENKLKDMQG